LIIGCQQETNPYRDGMRSAAAPASDEQASNPSNSPDRNNNADQNEEVEPVVADPNSFDEAQLTSVEVICGNQTVSAQFPTEFAQLCSNSQATELMAQLLASPFQGEGDPQPRFLRLQDNNGTSELMSAASLRINRPISEAFERREGMNNMSVNANGATFTITQSQVTAAQGTGHLGGFEVGTRMRVSVGIINITDTALQTRNFFDLTGDGSIIADVATLKPNAPENDAAILSNVFSFWIGEADSTTIVVITHQHINNRGQHARASDTFQAIAPQLDRSVYNILSN
jgi:hypothetical protein